MCQCELVLEPEVANDPDGVVGDECHIVARSAGFARYRDDLEYDADGYDNLILLCKTHHKQADDQPGAFTEHRLLEMKIKHEHWVRSSLDQNKTKENDRPATTGITLLPRVVSGKQMIALLNGAEVYQFDHEDIDGDTEVDVIADFLQTCQDYGDLLSDMYAGDIVRAGAIMQEHLDSLRSSGFLVFAERAPQWFDVGLPKQRYRLQLLTVVVLRESSPAIIQTESPIAVGMQSREYVQESEGQR